MNIPPAPSAPPGDAGSAAAATASDSAEPSGSALTALLASLGGEPAPAAPAGPGGKPGTPFAQILFGEVNLPSTAAPARGRMARPAIASALPPAPAEGKKGRSSGAAALPESPAAVLPPRAPAPALEAPAAPLPAPPAFLAPAPAAAPVSAPSAAPIGAPAADSSTAVVAPPAVPPPAVPPDALDVPRPFRLAGALAPAEAVAASTSVPVAAPAIPASASAAAPASAAASPAGPAEQLMTGSPALPPAAGTGPIMSRPAAGRWERRMAPVVATGAKTAGPLPVAARRVEALDSSANKNLLNDNNKGDASGRPEFGMSSAKAVTAMPSSASHPLAATVPAPRGALAAFATGPAAATPAPADGAVTHSAAVQAAIATVVQIADAQATRGEANATAVNLGFKIGDEHLGVRVEMRNGEVRTQFTTDSTDLRAALSHEWQALAPAPTSGAAPFAAPAFVSGHAPPQFDSPGGRGTPRQWDTDFSGGAARPSPKSAKPAPAAILAAPLAASAGRLLTFA